MEKDNRTRKGPKGGRPPKNDKAEHCVMVRFTDEEYARFMTLYEESGVYAKAVFIKAMLFGRTFRVIKTDAGTMEYAAHLSKFHAQFRAVGVNYNQVVRLLHSHFSQKKALSMLYTLEKATMELARIGQQVVELSEEFNRKY